ncbi:cytochrome b [Neisseria animalis]|uniref:Cytochrome b n=1 Tax=Neisseria animalis TaxID=492 RepID=A0A5P3MTE3_NEIAN|nr:cytochrome b/b6 domain-containing protein [Neisseria animalis]QEY24041.1 cytochrome b [Neisseria animalis]ROW32609.1 cytochrome b [Neisseria animalis]VEE06145.1 putative cytochrome B561 [Neisseria animalis]
MKIDTPERYGTFTRFVHWATALGYVFMFGSALAWNIDDGLAFLATPHKAVGILLFWLTLARLVTAVKNFRRRPQHALAVRIGHLALYMLMFAVPASGMARMAQVPFGGIHGLLAFLLLVLAAGHIAMALVHQCKGEKLMQRML